ncbi:MAG: hypothetical protein RLZZ361_285 [Cyanobacteriota bacterium]|jgi:hypothetical protein
MNQQFSQDFTNLFKWDEIAKKIPDSTPILSSSLKSQIMLTAETLDNSGIGITQPTKNLAIELVRRIHDYNSSRKSFCLEDSP